MLVGLSNAQKVKQHNASDSGFIISNFETIIPELGWLDSQHDWMASLVEELCNINSGTYNLAGLDKVKLRLMEEYASLDGEMTVHDVNTQSIIDDQGCVSKKQLGQLIHIRKRPDASCKTMLCIHMDTVYDAKHPFQKCQLLANGHLNGPGVADAKGGLVVMLAALKAFEKTSVAKSMGWEVVINPDEELGSPGSEAFIQSRAPHCDWGLLFEPSLPDGTLVSWRKGTGNFTFVVRGKAAHSGREFEKGRNAIVALSKLMDQVHGLNTDPAVTFNVGRISGGGALNIVPDLAIGRVNVRATTIEQQGEVEKSLQDLASQANADGISVELTGRFTSPPKILDAKAEQLQQVIERCSTALGQPVQWRGTGGASDGNKFAAAGLPNIDTLGPQGGNIHSSDEYLILESLVPCAKRTALTLVELARMGANETDK